MKNFYNVKPKTRQFIHPNVYSDDNIPEGASKVYTYTAAEFDVLINQKANKKIPQKNKNFSMLKTDGDLDDSLIGLSDLEFPEILTGGEF